MKISDLFKSNSSVNSNTGSSQKVESNQQEAQQKVQESTKRGEDTVNISPLARQFAQVSQIISEDAAERSSRVQELKAKVESGEYSVDSRDVAERFVEYVNDSSL